jgi:hypothetical protein
MRSFDQRNHGYLGYMMTIRGEIAGVAREFSVGIGKVAHAKHAFRAGDEATGKAVAVADPQLEPADYYKASALKLLTRPVPAAATPPPWLGAPPPRVSRRPHAQGARPARHAVGGRRLGGRRGHGASGAG